MNSSCDYPLSLNPAYQSDKGGYRYIDNKEMINTIPIEDLSSEPVDCFIAYHWEDRNESIVVTQYNFKVFGEVEQRYVDDSIRAIIEQDLRKKYHFSCNAVKFEL